MNPSVDLFMLSAAMVILLLTFVAAARTRSTGMRFMLR